MQNLHILTESGVSVTLEDIGEGANGDAEEGEPTLVRFSICRLVGDEWEPVDDASFCTRVLTSAPKAALERMARSIMDRVGNEVRRGESVRRICEQLSWLEVE